MAALVVTAATAHTMGHMVIALASSSACAPCAAWPYSEIIIAWHVCGGIECIVIMRRLGRARTLR